MQKTICQRLESVEIILQKPKFSPVKHSKQQEGHVYLQEKMLEKIIKEKLQSNPPE